VGTNWQGRGERDYQFLIALHVGRAVLFLALFEALLFHRRTVFFSHDESANGIFSHVSDQRDGVIKLKQPQYRQRSPNKFTPYVYFWFTSNRSVTEFPNFHQGCKTSL